MAVSSLRRQTLRGARAALYSYSKIRIEAAMDKTLTLACLGCGKANRFPAGRAAEGPKCGACGAPLADGSVAEIDLACLDRALATDGLPLLVDFWAPWCGPCRAMAPEFARAAQLLAGRARLAKIDTDRHPDAAARFGIRGIPALVLFRDGREAGRLTGVRAAAEIAAFVRDRAPAAA
jgi:thioredoxin 2